MPAEGKPFVSLMINFLTRIDIEQTYKLGLDIETEYNAKLIGFFPWTYSNREAQYLSFICETDTMNKIIEKIKLSLKVADDNLHFRSVRLCLQKN